MADEFSKLMNRVDRHLAGEAPQPSHPVVIDRADERASDPAYYREMKATADALGVEIMYVDSRLKPAEEQAPGLYFRDELRGETYFSKALVKEIGYQKLLANALTPGDEPHIFSARDELPQHALSLYDKARQQMK